MINVSVNGYQNASDDPNSPDNPENLQYLMGHSDVGTTLNIYTHSRYEDAAKEMLNIRVIDTDTKQNERRTG